MTKEDIIAAIENMTVLELSELVKELQERFGVTAAARSRLLHLLPVLLLKQLQKSRTEFDVKSSLLLAIKRSR